MEKLQRQTCVDPRMFSGASPLTGVAAVSVSGYCVLSPKSLGGGCCECKLKIPWVANLHGWLLVLTPSRPLPAQNFPMYCLQQPREGSFVRGKNPGF